MAHPNGHINGILPTFKAWWGHIWRFILTGLLVWVPLIITLWVSWLAVSKLWGGLDNVGRNIVLHLNVVGTQIRTLGFLARLRYWPGMGLVVAVMLFLATGFFARYLVGRQLIAFGEQIIQRIPLISRIYRSVQQVRDVFIGRGGAVFQKVCLIEYPRPGMTAVAFVTAQEQGLVQEALGVDMVAVFVPTTPNPTSGYLIYLPTDDVIILDISIEDAMKLIISAGAYLPERLKAGHEAVPPPDAAPQ